MLRVASKTFANKVVAHQIRFFHVKRAILAAKIYDMPAMSPTMESGAIVEWHVKEGQTYASGDSLLDIETDKATISVDAIDEGIVAKILLPDGTKDIKVGTPIAILAEEGDDLATLELPAVTSKQATALEAAPTPVVKTESKTEEKSSTPATSKYSGSSSKANPNQRLFPSVELLLHQNKISEADALENIPATGPHGRILKGDVLAYLGKISSIENVTIADYLEKTSHLDLSNIKIKEAPKISSTETTPVEEGKSKSKSDPLILISHSYPLGIEVSYPDLKSFKEHIANVISETEQITYAHKLTPDSDLDDPLFDELVAPARNAERFKIDYKVNYEEGEVASVDINLSLNPKCYDAKERAQYFVNEFKDNLAIELAELSE